MDRKYRPIERFWQWLKAKVYGATACTKPRHDRLCWLSSRETRVRQVFLQQNATEIISVVKNMIVSYNR